MSLSYNWWFVFHVWVSCFSFMFMFNTHISCSCFIFTFCVHVSCSRFVFMFHAHISCLCSVFTFRVFVSWMIVLSTTGTHNVRKCRFITILRGCGVYRCRRELIKLRRRLNTTRLEPVILQLKIKRQTSLSAIASNKQHVGSRRRAGSSAEDLHSSSSEQFHWSWCTERQFVPFI